MRIAGITIPDNKQLVIGLTEVYGVGRSRAEQILSDTKVDLETKAKDLSDADEKKLREAVESYTIEGDLKREISGNIKRLKDIKTYRGSRHAKGISTRGQRTKTNARTVPNGIQATKRKRATMGSGKRKVEKK